MLHKVTHLHRTYRFERHYTTLQTSILLFPFHHLFSVSYPPTASLLLSFFLSLTYFIFPFLSHWLSPHTFSPSESLRPFVLIHNKAFCHCVRVCKREREMTADRNWTRIAEASNGVTPNIPSSMCAHRLKACYMIMKIYPPACMKADVSVLLPQH